MPPAPTPVTVPKSLRTVQVTSLGVPATTVGTSRVAGSTVTPSSEASSVKGVLATGEVRRDSTRSSQTPGCGFA